MRLKKGCAAMKCFKQSLEMTMECGMGEKHKVKLYVNTDKMTGKISQGQNTMMKYLVQLT